MANRTKMRAINKDEEKTKRIMKSIGREVKEESLIMPDKKKMWKKKKQKENNWRKKNT